MFTMSRLILMESKVEMKNEAAENCLTDFSQTVKKVQSTPDAVERFSDFSAVLSRGAVVRTFSCLCLSLLLHLVSY